MWLKAYSVSDILLLLLDQGLLSSTDIYPTDIVHQGASLKNAKPPLREVDAYLENADTTWDEYSGTLVSLGFLQGTASACVFVHPQRHVAVSVH